MDDTASTRPSTSGMRTRWAAIGAAVAVTIGAVGTSGSLPIVGADTQSGERAVYTAISPCRLLDTRQNTQIGPRGAALTAGETAILSARGAQGDCSAADLPADATALAFNVTAVGASELTFLTFWPDGAVPDASSLNPAPGQPPVPNAVTTRLSDTGTFRIFNNAGTVNLIIDVVGIYTDHGHDDRYYTKAEADERFTPSEIDVLYPHLGDGIADGDYGYGGGFWTRPGDGTEQCITFPVEVPDGRTVERIDVRHTSENATEAEVFMFSLTSADGSIASEAEVFGINLITANTIPASGDERIATFSFEDDPSNQPDLTRTTTVDNGTAILRLCTRSGPFTITGLEIHLTPA